MGIAIIIIAAVLEAALAIYSIKTKSVQKRVRSWTRIGEFTAFAALALTVVIQWSFRWKLLGLVLFVWALLGCISIIRNREVAKGYKPVPIVFKAIALWLVVVMAVIPALVFPQYQQPKATGTYKVNTAVYTYTDKNRIETFNNKGENRRVTVEFWYPKDAQGKYPLVVFSHGAFGVRSSNTSTFNDLASNGYIVCSINHPYHSMYNKDTEGTVTTVDRSFLQEVLDANNGVYDDETVFKLERKWLKLRTEDMNFVLDTIKEKAKDSEAEQVYQHIDISKIGLIGHSLGGAASVQLGRNRDDISAVIDLDGSMLGEVLSYANGKPVINNKVYPIPILTVYTDAMKQAMASVTDPSIVLPEKLILDTAPHAYEVYFKGTNHFSVTDLPLVSPILVKMINGSIKNSGGGQGADKYYVIEKMNSVVLEFFDSYLKGSGNFQSAGTY